MNSWIFIFQRFRPDFKNTFLKIINWFHEEHLRKRPNTFNHNKWEKMSRIYREFFFFSNVKRNGLLWLYSLRAKFVSVQLESQVLWLYSLGTRVQRRIRFLSSFKNGDSRHSLDCNLNCRKHKRDCNELKNVLRHL